MRRRDKRARNLIAKIEVKRLPAPGESQRDQGEEQAEAQQRNETQGRSVAVGESPSFGAEPEGIACEPYRQIGDAGKRRDMTIAAAMVHIPELRLPDT